MYINFIIKSRRCVKKESKKQEGKGIYHYMVAGLINTILCTITIIILIIAKQVIWITLNRRLKLLKVTS